MTKPWLAAGMLLCAAWLAHAQPAPPLSLRPELVTPLRAAQEQLQEKQFAKALATLGATDAIAGKTPQETYTVERMRAAAASGAGDTAQMAKSLEAAIASGLAPQAEQAALLEALAGAHFGLKQYPQAAQWARRYLQQGTPKPEMRMLLVQALYQGADYKAAATELRSMLEAQRTAGQVPSRAQLELLGATQVQLKDEAGYAAVLEQMLTHYPSKDHWADLLVRVERKNGFDARLTIDLFRLQFAAGALVEGTEYLELAQLALQAGYPAEASTVVEAGYAAKALGDGPEAEKHQRFREQVKERAQGQLKTLESAPAPTAADEIFQHGYALFTQGRTEAGLAAMQQAVDKGGLTQAADARLRLGMAYARSGNRDRAAFFLMQVERAGNPDGSADIARLGKLLFK